MNPALEGVLAEFAESSFYEWGWIVAGVIVAALVFFAIVLVESTDG